MTIAVSSEFKTKIKASNQIVTKVENIQNGTIVTSPYTLTLEDGSITEDKTNAIRRRAKFTILVSNASNNLVPDDLRSFLGPRSGNEIKPYRGIMTSAGPEYIALGVFGYRDVDISDSGESLKIEIDGFDRSDRIARSRFSDVYIIASGTPVETAIYNIINSRYSGLTYQLSATGYTTPRLVYERGDDPWQACTNIAESAGLEVFFDNNGVVVVRQEPNPATHNADWTYTSGTDATINSVNRKLSAPEYNDVWEIAEGTNIAVPFSGRAYDNNTSSPTYIGNGDFPTFHVSEFYTSQTQCQAAANAKLLKILGATENVRFNCLVNPALSVGDIVSINQPRVKISNILYVTDKVTTPMTALRGQESTVRERTLAA